MADSALQLIGNLDEIELKEFLRNNGMNDCLTIFDSEVITGESFLNLSKSDFIRWKNHISNSEVKKLKKFWRDLKENPNKFVLPSTKSSTAQNASPFLQELERTLINKSNTLKRDKNIKDQRKPNQDNHITNLPHTETHNSEPIYQNVIEDLDQQANNSSSKLNIVELKKCTIKDQEIPASFKRNQNTDSKYYFNMKRSEAEVFLKRSSNNGAYLFRPSTQHYCALSVLFENEVKHFGVKSVRGNKLELVTVGNDLRFNSLDDIVKYFRKRPILRTATSQKIIRLSDPLLSDY